MAEHTARAFGSSFAAHTWGWLMVRGILALLLGVGAVWFPLSAVYAFTLLFAAYAFVDGIASLVAGVKGARAGKRWGALLFRGIVGLLVGLIFIVMPVVATVTYAFFSIIMLAAWSIIAGVLEIYGAVRLRNEIEGEWLLGLSGAFSVLLGLAILIWVLPNPVATLLSAAWLIAIYAFAAGLVLVSQAFRMRAASKM